jgi:hypothetical protein
VSKRELLIFELSQAELVALLVKASEAPSDFEADPDQEPGNWPLQIVLRRKEPAA